MGLHLQSGGGAVMKFASVCSGIEAASVAWKPLGWEPQFFSEIEPFCCNLLKKYYPGTPNLGDMTRFKEWSDYAVDVLVGGTPCQSFSVAGLRKGMDDPRGNLALTYLAIADKFRPRWLVWENVPGVLSSNGGRDFGAFVGGMAELGYGFAYRIFDAQYAGVPQRRRRLFVVGCSGDWRCAAAVLFERHSLQGHPAPSREKRQNIAGAPGASPESRCGIVTMGAEADGQVAHCLTTRPGLRRDGESETFIVYGIQANVINRSDEHGGNGIGISEDVSSTLTTSDRHAISAGTAVRRLTPLECERLQGFSDNYTLINYRGKPAADTPRYAAIGNSMPVPVMHWIGERIELVERLEVLQ